MHLVYNLRALISTTSFLGFDRRCYRYNQYSEGGWRAVITREEDYDIKQCLEIHSLVSQGPASVEGAFIVLMIHMFYINKRR